MLADELVRVAERARLTEVLLEGLELRALANFELGDVTAFDTDLDRLAQLGRDLSRRRTLAQVAQWRATRAMTEGRFGDATRFADAVLDHAGEIDSFRMGHTLQLAAIDRLQSASAHSLDAVAELVAAYPWFAVGSIFHALLLAEAGQIDDARCRYDQFVSLGIEAVPHDWTRTLVLVALAELCQHFHDAMFAGAVYGALAPYSGYLVVATSGTSCEGAVDHFLGMLATTAGSTDTAQQHFGAAIALEERIGATALVDRTRAVARSAPAPTTPGPGWPTVKPDHGQMR